MLRRQQCQRDDTCHTTLFDYPNKRNKSRFLALVIQYLIPRKLNCFVWPRHWNQKKFFFKIFIDFEEDLNLFILILVSIVVFITLSNISATQPLSWRSKMRCGGALDSQSDKQHVKAGPNHVGKVIITNQTRLLKNQHWSTAVENPGENVTNQNECCRINGRELMETWIKFN